MSATTDVAAPVKKLKTAVSNLALGSADDALTLATELQKFVKENKLTSVIQGKQFPNVEAWMFAGSLLGLSSLLETIEDKSTADEIKWHATVTIQNVRTGATVGRGFATCSNKESTKRGFADYAICSMAQTRAVGKAYRLSLGWLMKAAGYEATPAEEMQEVGTSAEMVAPADPALLELQWRTSLESATSTAELKEIWGKMPKQLATVLLAVKDEQKRFIDEVVAADAAGMTLEQYRQQPQP